MWFCCYFWLRIGYLQTHDGWELKAEINKCLISSNTYLARSGIPDLEGVVIRARDDGVARKLEAGDNVIIMALEDPRWPEVSHTPVHLYSMLTHEGSLAEEGKKKEGVNQFPGYIIQGSAWSPPYLSANSVPHTISKWTNWLEQK